MLVALEDTPHFLEGSWKPIGRSVRDVNAPSWCLSSDAKWDIVSQQLSISGSNSDSEGGRELIGMEIKG